MLGQIFYLIRRFGLFHLIRLKHRHDEATRFIRGRAATGAIWALMSVGFLDDLKKTQEIPLKDYAQKHNLDPEVLETLVEYLDCLRVLRLRDGFCRLAKMGEHFVEEARGDFDLARGYEPVLASLEGLLSRKKTYGQDIQRLGHYIAAGSGELGIQLPFPMMHLLIQKHGFRRILDLGCGDLEFLFMLCQDRLVRCWGIDNSQEAVRYALSRLSHFPFSDRLQVAEMDMFDLERLRQFASSIDAITAIDIFHEYLKDGPDRILDYLRGLKSFFQGAHLVVAEFCEQPREKLRRHPTGFLEHHFFHQLTQQVILRADEWRKIFTSAGFSIIDEKVFDIVGHGYFVLR